jgi:sulfur-oxidizing protein SoxY
MATPTGCVTRRLLLGAGVAGAAGMAAPRIAAGDDDAAAALALVRRLTERDPIESPRLRLTMPREFPTGSIVPLTLSIDSPMSEADHVRRFDVLAPKNPIVEVMSFHFKPLHSEPRVSTRIRLSAPQFVVALAHLSDGTLLMAKTWVAVATDGCQ